MQEKKPVETISVRYIKGIGPAKAMLFQKIGIKNVGDIFYYLPHRYEDRSRLVPLKDIEPGKAQTIIGKVISANIFTAKTGTCIVEVVIGDERHRVYAVWYNQPFRRKMFFPGQTIVLYGKVELQRHLQISHPVFEIIDENKEEFLPDKIKNLLDIGRIVPIYSLTENLSQKYMRKMVYRTVFSYARAGREALPTALRARQKLVDIKFAVENIHFPNSFENLERAHKRLVFEEFFILQAIMALKRERFKKKGLKHEIINGLFSDFKALFPFEFTAGQEKCMKEIEADMADAKPMYRLLQGDVGSGKTLIAMYALLLAVKNNYQAVMMAPTEILARQHYMTVSKIFMPLGINVRLLINGISRKAKDIIKKELALGEADMVIGTHALIQDDIKYERVGIIVVDEQHKFGVLQRKALWSKGKVFPDMLVMTATPIPRSLALTIFGDMDISLLEEKPAGRGEVITYWAEEEYRDNVYKFIRNEIGKGRQAFIVYPRIKKSEKSGIKSAEEMRTHLQENIFKDLSLALIHGRMKHEEKERVMDEFRLGKYHILVATTVIEVGVDVPNVSVIVIEHAERYGLAQLHQMRGRIGRASHESYCVLMGRPATFSAHRRLSAISETDDGFKVAEEDLEIRGTGEFLGLKQSGLAELRFGDVLKDFEIMERAREEAFDLIKRDPDLKDPRNLRIRQSLVERFGPRQLSTISG